MQTTKQLRFALAIALGAQLACAGDLPDNRLTTGYYNPDVTQENIHSTVCVKGYSKAIRPPSYFTNKLKKRQLAEYGYADTNPQHYDEDHLIPLSIGGSPDHPKNLWPQPRFSEWNAEKKDRLEFKIYRLVCEGKVPLNEARQAMAENWIEAYKRYMN
jgi:hypothetical protein